MIEWDCRSQACAAGQAVEIRLELPDGPLCARAIVEDRPARLAEVVPIARRLCDELAGRAFQRAAAAGAMVPCRKGCDACCRYLVPLSPPEAFHLWDGIQRIAPGPREELLATFSAAGAKVRAAVGTGLSTQMKLRLARRADGAAMSSVESWYTRLHLDCPLLAGKLCGMYDDRPLACRGYFVTSPPCYCRDTEAGLGKRLSLGVQPVQALCRLTADVEHLPPQAVLLPLAPSWALENLPRALRTWPLPELVSRLADILGRQLQKARQGAREPAA